MRKGIKEELARHLLSIVVACAGGELIIDGNGAQELLKGTKLVMVPYVTQPLFKVLLLDEPIEANAVEVLPEELAA